MLKDRVKDLEYKYEKLDELLKLVDEYSRHFMEQTMTQITIMIAIATTVILGAAYFMIKNIINHQVENEVEKKVLGILVENPPIYYARGKAYPSDNKIVLSESITGIKDLEPDTLMILDVKIQSGLTWGQLDTGLNPVLKINEHGQREIELGNYLEKNGEVSWSLAWIRNKYK